MRRAHSHGVPGMDVVAIATCSVASLLLLVVEGTR
jgi:hypothetical protein